MVSNVTPAPRQQIYLMGGRGAPGAGRSDTAVWNLPLSYVFIRVFLHGRAAAARHSYHKRSTNDGVELPDGTPQGVRDLYPVWLPWFFSPSPREAPPPALTSYSLFVSLVPRGLNPISLSPSWFVPYRCSRDQDVLQNKRLYLHARPSEKPPSSGGGDVNRR